MSIFYYTTVTFNVASPTGPCSSFFGVPSVGWAIIALIAGIALAGWYRGHDSAPNL